MTISRRRALSAGLTKTTSLCSGGSCLAGTGSLIYQTTYEYDGMMRLVSSKRNDLDDNPMEWISYEYDAASNIKTKVQQVFEAPADEAELTVRGDAHRSAPSPWLCADSL